jgi:hypothetical protein
VIKKIDQSPGIMKQAVQDGSCQFKIDFTLSFFRDHRNLMPVCLAGIGEEKDKW